MKPQTADTGFGYIECGEALIHGFKVKHFHEKPDLKKAESFIKQPNFFWNSGIFCFHIGQFLDEIKTYAPDVIKHAENSLGSCLNHQTAGLNKIEIPLIPFIECPNISIDYALM